MPITALPTPPTRSDPENFAERADAFLAALSNFVTQANALQAENEAAASTAATAAAQAVLNSKANLSGAAFTGDISTTGKLTVTGNIGQSITPSASWWASMRAHEIGRAGNGVFGSTSDDEVNVSANVINTGSGTYVYGASDTASLYRQVAGQHVWYAAAAGTAGAAIPLVELGRFSSSGNFGIGVVPGSARLDVRSANSGAEVVAQFGNATQIGPLQIITDSNTEWGFNTLNSRDLIFKTNQTHRMRIDASGTVLVGKTTATANGGDVQVSKGVTFPATQVACSDPNTLDDYEEGSFTPRLDGTTLVGTGTYGTQVGKYTKVGNVVHFTIALQWSAHTGTGNMTISGLPFTGTVLTSYPQVYINGITLTAGNTVQGYIAVGSVYVVLTQVGSDGSAPASIPMDTSGQFSIHGHYYAI